jgi:hypothetical protein
MNVRKSPMKHELKSTHTAQSSQESSNTQDTGDGRLTSSGQAVVGTCSSSVVGVTGSKSAQVGRKLVKTRSGRVLPTENHSRERLEET